MAKDLRTRNWNVIVYPDSAPADWREVLEDLKIQWVESPLHDMDCNPDGEIKKAHWHILLAFEGNKSFEQVKEITDKLNAPIPVKCISMKGAIRYMAHMDNPEKYQYSPNLIISHGGFDLESALKPTSSQRLQVISEIMDYIDQEDITEYVDLLQYARLYKFDSWFAMLCDSCSYVVGQYIKSNRHKRIDDNVKALRSIKNE